MSVTSGGTWQAGPETRPELVPLAPAGLLLALAVRGNNLRGGGKPAGMAGPRIPEPACGAAQPHMLSAMTASLGGEHSQDSRTRTGLGCKSFRDAVASIWRTRGDPV